MGIGIMQWCMVQAVGSGHVCVISLSGFIRFASDQSPLLNSFSGMTIAIFDKVKDIV